MPTSSPTILVDDAVIVRLIQTHADAALSDEMAVTMINEDPPDEDDPELAPLDDHRVKIVRLEVKRRPRQKNEGVAADGRGGGHVSEADCSVQFELVQGAGETLESTIADKVAVMKVVRAFDEVTLIQDGHRLQFGPAETRYNAGELAQAGSAPVQVTLSHIVFAFEAIRTSGTGMEAG